MYDERRQNANDTKDITFSHLECASRLKNSPQQSCVQVKSDPACKVVDVEPVWDGNTAAYVSKNASPVSIKIKSLFSHAAVKTS
jgi:hypothetical protein